MKPTGKKKKTQKLAIDTNPIHIKVCVSMWVFCSVEEYTLQCPG